MANINVKKVCGRYRKDFENFRKDSATALAEIRRFFTAIKKPKDSDVGRRTTYLQIEQQLGATQMAAKELSTLLFSDEIGGQTLVEQCDYDESQTRNPKERYFWCYTKYVDSILKYVEKFGELAAKPHLAHNDIVLNYGKLVKGVGPDGSVKLGYIDSAAICLTKFGVKIDAYLRSDHFEALAADPHSNVVIKQEEILGTKLRRTALLQEIDADVLEEARAAREEIAQLVDENESEELLDKNGRLINPDADREQEEADDANDAARNSDNASQTSEGGALFEANIARQPKNIEAMAYVEANSVERGGRLLRKRRGKDDFFDRYAKLDFGFKRKERADDDEDEPEAASTNGGTREEDDGDSDSSDDEGGKHAHSEGEEEASNDDVEGEKYTHNEDEDDDADSTEGQELQNEDGRDSSNDESSEPVIVSVTRVKKTQALASSSLDEAEQEQQPKKKARVVLDLTSSEEEEEVEQ